MEYHPNAGKPTITHPFSEFTQENATQAYEPDSSTDPWYPFRSRLDFEFAELALEAALSKEQTTRLLTLAQRIHARTEKFTLQSYHDLQNMWKAAEHRMTPVSTYHPHHF